MEISGDLCEWEKIQGNLLGDNTLPPSLPPAFLSPAPEWRGSPLVSEREGPRCARSPEIVVRAALCISKGRRERGGEKQEVSLSTPPPLLDSLPLSLYVSLPQRSPYNHSPSPPLRITHSLTQACLHHSSVHINDYIKYIQVGSMGLWGTAALSACPFK